MTLVPATALVLAQLSAGAIVARVKDVETRIADISASATLTVEADGETKTREFQLQMKRDGVDYRAIIAIDAPRAMAGTQFLIHAARGKRNREWAYFPDLDLVRSISGKNQEDPFLSSDITYADLAGGAHLDDLRHTLIGEEQVDGETCYVLEGTPRRKIEYGKLRGFVRKRDFVTVQAIFYDNDGAPIKRARLTDVRELGSGALLAHQIEVQRIDGSSVSTLVLDDVSINQGLADELFTEDALGAR